MPAQSEHLITDLSKPPAKAAAAPAAAAAAAAPKPGAVPSVSDKRTSEGEIGQPDGGDDDGDGVQGNMGRQRCRDVLCDVYWLNAGGPEAK